MKTSHACVRSRVPGELRASVRWCLAGLVLAAGMGAGCGGSEQDESDTGKASQAGDASLPSDQGGSDGSETLASPGGNAGEVMRFGETRVRLVSASDGQATIQVVREGRVVLSRRAARIEVQSSTDAPSAFTQGTDATGDGVADLIFHEHTGANGCCSTFVVVGLGQSPEIVATLDAGWGRAMFTDLDGDGVFEFVGRDWAIAEMVGERFGIGELGEDDRAALSPPIVLRYEAGAYLLAPELMVEPEPAHAEVESVIERVLTSDAWDSGRPPASYWGYAAELMYTGHPELADRFLRWAWAPDVDGRDERIAEFREALEQSPYYGSLPR